METPAVTLQRLTSNEPLKCDLFKAENEPSHYLHKISWLEQMVLDSVLVEFGQNVGAAGVSSEISGAMKNQLITVGTLQLSLRTGLAPDSPRVFPTLEGAIKTLGPKPKEVFEAFEAYAKRFEVLPEEKKI